jgi:hypothetical protein
MKFCSSLATESYIIKVSAHRTTGQKRKVIIKELAQN